jgi:hypothetical protein
MPKWTGQFEEDEDYDYEKIQRIPQKPKVSTNSDEYPRKQNSKKIKKEKYDRN